MTANENLKPPSPCNCTNIRRASRALTLLYDKLLAPSGLKVTQYSLLRHLYHIGPVTMNEFSRAIRLDRTTLVRNLKPLEQAGLIRITTSSASQANQLCITDAGIQALDVALPYWQEAQRSTKELFTEEEFQVFRGALQKIESIIT